MRYKIYSKDGSTVRCETEKLEYNGQFMGDSSITASVKSMCISLSRWATISRTEGIISR